MNSLPVTAFRKQITRAVRDNSVVIITAETGAGKSTQVPQYLLEDGWNLVVTQPRKLAAQSVAERVAYERNETLGGVIGYRTSEDRCDSSSTRCLFCTDGLALVRELMRDSSHQVLVIDEVHEWNINIEVLIAWVRHQLALGLSYKLVLMSATLDIEALSKYFQDAPIIEIPGRSFPIIEQSPGKTISTDAEDLLRRGRNVLIFQPGKREIEATVRELQERMGSLAEVLPLHGDLTAKEQAKCFNQPERPTCIVATNIAQTSVTVPFIDAVVDSGEERQVGLVDGIEGLYVRAISLADRDQRKGRAGRIKEGLYIDHCRARNRPYFPKAEILRSRLDQTVLRFSGLGIDMEKLEFFHQPNPLEIRQAENTLRLLGCVNDEGKVTDLGRKIAMLPISVRSGRILAQAERLGVADDALAIVALLESGEITDRNNTVWRELCPGEEASDLLGQFAVYKAALLLSVEKMEYCGILSGTFLKAKRIHDRLVRFFSRKLDYRSTGTRKDLIKAICTGFIDHVYYMDDDSRLWSRDGRFRKLGRGTLINQTGWVLGLPWDVETRNEGSGSGGTQRLLQYATKVDPSVLHEIAREMYDDLSQIEWVSKGIPLPGGRLMSICPEKDVETQTCVERSEVRDLVLQAQALKEQFKKLRDGCVDDKDHESLLRQIDTYQFSLLPLTATRLEIWLEKAGQALTELNAALQKTEQQLPVSAEVATQSPTKVAIQKELDAIDSSPRTVTGRIRSLEKVETEISRRLAALREARELIGKSLA